MRTGPNLRVAVCNPPSSYYTLSTVYFDFDFDIALKVEGTAFITDVIVVVDDLL
jgi:hypothetical protein